MRRGSKSCFKLIYNFYICLRMGNKLQEPQKYKREKFHWALALGFYLAISLCMLN